MIERSSLKRLLVASGVTSGLLLSASAFAATPAERLAECADNATLQNALPGSNLDFDAQTDEVVLDFEDSMSDAEVKEFATAWGLDVRLNSVHSDDPNVYIATVGEGDVPALHACLTGLDGIEGVEENVWFQMFEQPADESMDAPNDPLYQFQWNFKQVNAEKAWKTSSGKDVVVAVIDTGVAAEDAPDRNIKAAKDLAGTEIVAGYDFVDDDAFAWDGHGHGTHVAGTIAQTTNNKYGVAGLAHGAKIMPLRVLNSRGFGQVSDIADSIRFSADNGAQVINMSLGGPLPSLVMKRSIDHAHKKGVTIVAAAGNGGKKAKSYPAAYNHVVAVAATQFDRSTTFYSQWGDFVDIAAPGGNTRVDQNNDGRPDGVMQETLKNGKTNEHDFALYMGTSMASPHVAAGAALVISQGVTHPDKVEKMLQETASDSESDRYGDKEYRERYGAGIMQADAAAEAAVTEQGTWRITGAAFLMLLALVRVRRKDAFDLTASDTPMFVGATVMAASGLFFLPMLFGDASLAAAFSRPLAELDLLFLGIENHQNPLMASALLPLAAVGLLAGTKRLRFAAAGLAIGMSAFLFTEAFILTSDVRWIPGMDLLDRVWLLGNGAISFVLGYLTLKKK